LPLALIRAFFEDATSSSQGGSAVANDRTLESWISRNVDKVRGLRIEFTGGKGRSLFPPFFIGDDFVAGR